MKKLVLVAGILLLLSLVFPNGVKLPSLPAPVVVPVAPDGAVDATIAKLLSTATAEDKARVASIYDGMAYVLRRDAGKRLNTTEKWVEFQANTLQLAVEQVGKYPGLDKAIEDVFLAKLGTDDVLPGTPETQAKLLDACETIANSAR
jgi:hypothetical protein